MSTRIPTNPQKYQWIMLTVLGVLVVGGIVGLGTLAMVATRPQTPFQVPGLAASATPLPTATQVPSSIGGMVWHDLCAAGLEGEPSPSTSPLGCVTAAEGGLQANGRFESGEPGIPGISLRLGAGICPSVGLASTTTTTDGSFLFVDLAAGSYCVSVDPADPANAFALLPGIWTYPQTQSGQTMISVEVGPGESNGMVNFGWDHQFLPLPEPTPVPTVIPPTAVGPTCTDKVTFVQDISIPDNTNLQPGVRFEKVWRLRNAGTCTWSKNYALVFVSGHSMSGPASVALPSDVAPGSTLDLKVSLVAPTASGTYRGNWQLRNPAGRLFGLGENSDKPFWVQIVVGPAGQTIGGTWKGEYFANRELKGTPALVRNDAVIDFDWKQAAPATGVPADDFSVRWTGKAQFEGGTWRFRALMDDGVRLWIDNQLVIDEWKDGGSRELTADVALVKGEHSIRLEYYERTREARIRLRWEKVSAPSFPEWKAEFWSNRDLQGNPVLVRSDRSIDFTWEDGSPAAGIPGDNFSARWTRTLNFESGVYRFSARSDDGFRLFLDGKLIIDEWRDSSGSTLYSAERTLSGSHTLKVEYYERAGKAMVKLSWERLAPTPTQTVTPTPTTTPTTEPTSTPTVTPTPTETPGPISQVIYDFQKDYCNAILWYSGGGELPCPGTPGAAGGHALLLQDPKLEDGSSPLAGLLTHPQPVEDGYIRGVYPGLTVQTGDRFTAKLGCLAGNAECKVTFRLLGRANGSATQMLGEWVKSADGKLLEVEVGLDGFAGKSVIFTLEVHATGSAKDDMAVWLQPRIMR